MHSILLASVPIHGHVNQMLAIAAGLVARGHEVRYLTGRRFADAVTETGAVFVPLPDLADYDDRLLGERGDGPRVTGLAAIRRDVTTTFLDPALLQYRALLAEHAARPVDVVMADATFVGAALLAALPGPQRPLVLGAGILPLGLTSRHVAPFGLGLPPLRGPLNIPRNVLLRLFVERIALRPVQQELDALFRSVHGRPSAFAFSWFSTVDAVVQFTVPSFEYPRPDAVTNVHFVGPANRTSGGSPSLPAWWSDIEAASRVMVVTQGTIANADFDELVRPTIDALRDEDGILVVTTGGRPVSNLGPLPSNVRAAEFVPYDRLLPLADVLITNGGYGGVHFALEHAVPIVAAGDTEDKPEVAARVAWSGVGIDLRSGRPSAEAIRHAVRSVLGDPRHREAARRVADEIARSGGVDDLVAIIDALRHSRSTTGRATTGRAATGRAAMSGPASGSDSQRPAKRSSKRSEGVR